MQQVTMSIGAVARITGINANTLRMWERRYQLGASKRSRGGQREYTSTDIDHLRLIKKLLRQGMRIGDIAQLPTKTLSSLLIESGDLDTHEGDPAPLLATQVVGLTLANYFREHIRRYPKLAIEFVESEVDAWLNQAEINDKQLVIIQLSSLGNKQLDPILQISRRKIHVIVVYLYSSSEIVDKLQAEGVQVLQGHLEASLLDEAIDKVLRLVSHFSELDRSSKAFDVSLPTSQPRQFDENALLEAEAISNKLNCECPSHLSDLIRRLNAFEEYSQQCGAENWKQAAVHACVYSYANQARYCIEKALLAVMDE